jgi:hypothetical protein
MVLNMNSKLKPVTGMQDFETLEPSLNEKSSIKPVRVRTLVLMYILSAALGMLLDNYHGLFGVLSYEPIGIPISITLQGHTILKSALWVPFLFGSAGFVMAYIGLDLDSYLKTNEGKRAPSWHKTLYSISLFSAQYYLSGLLDNLELPSSYIHAALLGLATLGYMIFDFSASGFILAILTAVAGPLAEIILINVFHLYSYQHVDIWGICSWIPWVYFLGAPAVLNLARSIENSIKTPA